MSSHTHANTHKHWKKINKINGRIYHVNGRGVYDILPLCQ